MGDIEVESGADHNDCAQLADLVPTRCNRRREDVRGQLKLNRECQITCQRQPDHDVTFWPLQRKRPSLLPRAAALHEIDNGAFDRVNVIWPPSAILRHATHPDAPSMMLVVPHSLDVIPGRGLVASIALVHLSRAAALGHLRIFLAHNLLRDHVEVHHIVTRRSLVALRAIKRARRGMAKPRSEEHTSELQSR